MSIRMKLLAPTAAAAIAVLGSSTLQADLPRGYFPNAASTLFADVTGDGRADAIALGDGMVTLGGVNTGDGVGITVRPAATTTNRFGPSQAFTSDVFVGTLSTAFADVDGDSVADGIAVDHTGIGVRYSTGAGLLPRVQWIGRRTWAGSLPADSTFAFANLDGMPGVEAIAISAAASGGFPQVFMATRFDRYWAPMSMVQGQLSTVFADVTGDGHADAVAFNAGNITVQEYLGGFPPSFSPPVPFTNEPFRGDLGTHVADVDGNGMADLVALNAGNILVRISSGSEFLPCTKVHSYECPMDRMSEYWSTTGFSGEIGTYFAPVAWAASVPIHRRADVIAVNRSGILVRPSTALAFAPVVDFTSQFGVAQPFYGEANAIYVGWSRPPRF